jgi:hypothetical protein
MSWNIFSESALRAIRVDVENAGSPDVEKDPDLAIHVEQERNRGEPISEQNSVESTGASLASTDTRQEPSEEEGKEEDPKLPGFSANASKAFFVFHNKYLVDLERMSRFKAKQGSAEIVSAQQVRESAAFLSSLSAARPKKTSRYCETVGGILLGAGISELLILLGSTKTSGKLLTVTAVLIGLGSGLIGIFLGRD